jgi:hypothetical protein
MGFPPGEAVFSSGMARTLLGRFPGLSLPTWESFPSFSVPAPGLFRNHEPMFILKQPPCQFFVSETQKSYTFAKYWFTASNND